MAIDLCDDNTIGVGCMIGSTYDGEYEDVKMLNDLLEEKVKNHPELDHIGIRNAKKITFF